MEKLKLTDIISIFLRSFLVQAVWNYQSMLSLGFCFAIIPVGKKLFKTKEERSQFLKRHLDFFNAHPYFATFAMGAISKIEMQLNEQKNPDFSQIQRFKKALIGPLGAMGDQLIWAIIKPASLIVGVIGIMLLDNFHSKIIFLISIGLLYNIPHIYIRIYGIIKGFNLGFQVYKVLSIDKFTVLKKLYSWIGSVSIGIFIGYILFSSTADNFVETIGFVTGGFSAYIISKFHYSFYVNIFLSLVIGLIIGNLAILI